MLMNSLMVVDMENIVKRKTMNNLTGRDSQYTVRRIVVDMQYTGWMWRMFRLVRWDMQYTVRNLQHTVRVVKLNMQYKARGRRMISQSLLDILFIQPAEGGSGWRPFLGASWKL